MAITIDQADLGHGNQSAGTSVSWNTTAAVASGAWIIGVAGGWASTGTITSAVFSGGGLTWTTDKLLQAGSRFIAIARAYAPSGLASGTSLTFSATGTGSVGADRQAGAFSVLGLDTSTPLDTSNSRNASASAWDGGSMTPTAGDRILIAAGFLDGAGGGSASSTPATNYTEVQDFAYATSNEAVSAVYRLVTADGVTAYTPGGTWSASFSWAGAGVTYKAAAGGGATVTAVPAAGIGDVVAPVVNADSTVTALPAAAVGDLVAPVVSGQTDATVLAVPCAGTGDLVAPAGFSSEVTAAAAAAVGDVPAPVVSGTGDATVTAVPAAGVGDVVAPAVSADATVTAAPTAGTGDLVVPSVSPAPAAPTFLPPLVTDQQGVIPPSVPAATIHH